MGKMFFYTRREPNKVKEGEEPTYTSYTDCFNLDLVIRGIQLEDGRLVVLLNDIHQRTQPREVRNKQGKITAVKNELMTFQSEIYLERHDAERFYNLTRTEV